MSFLKTVLLTSSRICNHTQVRYISRVVSPTLKEYERRRQILKGTKGPIPKPKRNTFLDWNHDSEVFAFGKRLNEEFDKSLLQQAFTQRAYIIQEEERQKEVGIDNPEIQLRDCRELSIEGESFMRNYIHMYLEAALPKFPEPGIVSITNYLMTEEKLAYISRFLGTHDLILTVEHPVSNPVLAETFKAIVAALVHSSGTERAAHFVRDFVITQLNGLDVNELWPIEDPIGMLADILNKSSKKPEPRLIGQVGMNTVIPCYAIGIFVDKELVSEGYGETVAVAHEMAARVALQEFFETTDNMRPINFRIPGLPRKANQKKLQEQMQTS